MFSNIKMKYLVFCAKPVEDKFLASAMRQNSIHLQFFIIASVLLQNSLFLIKSSQIQHAYLCGTHIFERIKYPELTHKHVQQLVTLSVHPVEQNSLYIFFPHLQLSVEETPAFQIQRHPSWRAFHVCTTKEDSSHWLRDSEWSATHQIDMKVLYHRT